MQKKYIPYPVTPVVGDFTNLMLSSIKLKPYGFQWFAGLIDYGYSQRLALYHDNINLIQSF